MKKKKHLMLYPFGNGTAKIEYIIDRDALSDLSEGLPIRKCYIITRKTKLLFSFADHDRYELNRKPEALEVSLCDDDNNVIRKLGDSGIALGLLNRVADALESHTEELLDEVEADVVCTDEGCPATYYSPEEDPQYEWSCAVCQAELDPDTFEVVIRGRDFTHCEVCGQLNRCGRVDDSAA